VLAEIITSSKINGVKFARLKAFADERGRFMETFRKEWFPERTWEKVQTNRSDSRAGVLRGLHYHFHQVDYWYCPTGRVRVAMADLRATSPTYGAVETLEIGDENPVGVFIPVGVAHGFAALADSTLFYTVDNYYTGGDEFGVAWDDPQLGIDWGVNQPILSGRDQANPRWAEIPADQRPN
jgi:dTDP-4-dehydrorhamnose 3,5-epimerase